MLSLEVVIGGINPILIVPNIKLVEENKSLVLVKPFSANNIGLSPYLLIWVLIISSLDDLVLFGLSQSLLDSLRICICHCCSKNSILIFGTHKWRIFEVLFVYLHVFRSILGLIVHAGILLAAHLLWYYIFFQIKIIAL